MAGYSGTPLPRKLGIAAGHHIGVLRAPSGFSLDELPDTVSCRTSLRGTPLDVILFFAKAKAEVAREFSALQKRLTPAGGLWICWPKKASGVSTDLTEDVIREIGLAHGLVDNKVCAVDETWSGLRFVRRLKDRAPKDHPPKDRARA